MKKLILILTLLSRNVFAVPEIPDYSINDIAITTVFNSQVVIFYNPYYCETLGFLVCNFFRAHEYGHVNLGHLIRRTYPAQAEYEADCWAAQNAPLQQVQAAYEHFMKQGYMGNWSHGTGIQRAERISQCNVAINNQNNNLRALSDSVFTSIERHYWELFPFNSYKTEEFEYGGGTVYWRLYSNGSGLAEWKGDLWYNIRGSVWELWGPIVEW